MNTLLIISPDKIGFKVLNTTSIPNNVTVVFDRSSTIKRILKLIYQKRIPISLVLKMAISEIRRKRERLGANFCSIHSNADVRDLIKRYKIDNIILFRAGLIIESDIIQQGIPIANIHAASLPKYGGLGSINRALKDRAVDQNACLHRVTEKIDEGSILDTQ